MKLKDKQPLEKDQLEKLAGGRGILTQKNGNDTEANGDLFMSDPLMKKSNPLMYSGDTQSGEKGIPDPVGRGDIISRG